MVYQWIRFNHSCLLCDSPALTGSVLCRDCLAALPWIGNACPVCGRPMEPTTHTGPCGACLRRPPNYQHSLIPFLYAPPFPHLIKQVKFHQRLDLAKGLGRLMASYLQGRLDSLPETIIPVPLHPGRMRHRGYNQALELARPLARELGLAIDTRLVRRRLATAEQSHLGPDARRKNVRGAFALEQRRPYRHVAILDDVVTSGNTVNELSRVLRASGIARVDVWSLCHAHPQ